MDPELSRISRSMARGALVPLFLCSGATSLVYETLWSRQLHLVFGTSQLAIATVLAAFMAGLALGGLLAARVVGRIARPLVAYAGLELFIGVYALIFPFLVQATTPLYVAFHNAAHPGALGLGIFQFLVLGLMLLPPTTCMGATLPLLGRFAVIDQEEAGVQIGRLYGANTLGAVLGATAAGFWLLPSLGLQVTTWLAVGGNLALSAVAYWAGKDAAPLDPAPPGVDRRAEPPALWAIAAITGFASLLLEVAWFRVLVLTLGGSAYAFSVMLLAFLLGIGTGGWIAGGLADAAWARGGRARTLLVLAGLQVGVGVLSWIAMYGYGELPYAYVVIFDTVEQAPELFGPAQIRLPLALMLPPTLLMGASFPFLVRAATGTDEAGGPTGRIYGANTVGAIFGAALGGFVLLPQLHVTGSVLLGVAGNATAAALALYLGWGRSPRFALGAAGLAGFVLAVHVWPPPWNPLLMTAGMYKYVDDLNSRTRDGVWRYAVEPYDLLFYDEGLSSVVTVAQVRSTGNVWLANNGKIDASSSADMPTQVLVTHIPFLFKPDAERVAVIGLASGVTAGAATVQTAPKEIDIIELEPAIVQASHLFDQWNNEPLLDPRVRLHTNDGRNQIVLAADQTYDIVVSEPSNPWLSGVSNLFTREFFEIGKRKLKPGGIWSQWVQMYGMDYDDLRSLLSTFADTWPHVRLFSTIEDADIVLVGSESPLVLDALQMQQIIQQNPKMARDLKLVAIEDAYDFLSLYHLDRDGILRQCEGVVRNTDDNMRIEYSAPLHLYDDTSEDNFLNLLHPANVGPTVPYEVIESLPDAIGLTTAYVAREDLLRALLTLEVGRARWPDDPELERLQVETTGSFVKELGITPAEARKLLDRLNQARSEQR